MNGVVDDDRGEDQRSRDPDPRRSSLIGQVSGDQHEHRCRQPEPDPQIRIQAAQDVERDPDNEGSEDRAQGPQHQRRSLRLDDAPKRQREEDHPQDERHPCRPMNVRLGHADAEERDLTLRVDR